MSATQNRKYINKILNPATGVERFRTNEAIKYDGKYRAYYWNDLQVEEDQVFAFFEDFYKNEIYIFRVVKQYKCGKSEREYYTTFNNFKFGIVGDLTHFSNSLSEVCAKIAEYTKNGYYIAGSTGAIEHSKRVYKIFTYFGDTPVLKGTITNGEYTKQ